LERYRRLSDIDSELAASVLLGMEVHLYFLWFTLFVGVSLLQSGFTNWCPMIAFLRKLGVKDRARSKNPLTA
jgi:hypothetical protein